MNKKYEILKTKPIKVGDIKLYRIKALRDFGNVKKDDIGGYIHKESNLSHEGECWIYDNAKVYGDAKVFDNAKVYGKTHIYGDAKIFRDAEIYGNSQVYGETHIYGYAQVSGKTKVFGCSILNSNYPILFENETYKDAAFLDKAKFPLEIIDNIKGFNLEDDRRNNIGTLKQILFHDKRLSYIATNGVISAHSYESYEDAKKQLKTKAKSFKENKLPIIKRIKNKGRLSADDYKELTGACEMVDEWVKEKGIKTKTITIDKLKELLKTGDYGYETAVLLWKELPTQEK